MGNSLLVQIEECREKMILLSKSKSFTSKEVVHASQHLDQLIHLHVKYSLDKTE